MQLNSSVFANQGRQTDRQSYRDGGTDGQTDGRTDGRRCDYYLHLTLPILAVSLSVPSPYSCLPGYTFTSIPVCLSVTSCHYSLPVFTFSLSLFPCLYFHVVPVSLSVLSSYPHLPASTVSVRIILPTTAYRSSAVYHMTSDVMLSLFST